MTNFTPSARYYDAIYRFKDYVTESNTLHALIQQHKAPGVPDTLLDVACGTGAHLAQLKDRYTSTGLDLDAALLDVAREKLTDVRFIQGDMTDFDLGGTFGVVTNLFSAIGYVETLSAMRQTVATMRRHLAPGGVLIVEPSFTPQTFKPGYVGARFVDDPGLKIARINLSTVEPGAENDLAVLNFRYLIGTPDGVDQFDERHALGLFPIDEYTAAFEAVGLRTIFDPVGIMDRGLVIGVA